MVSQNDSEDSTLYPELVEIDKSLDEIDMRFQSETLSLLNKFDSERAPLLTKRNKLASNINSFWLTAFRNHSVLGTLLENEDLEAFKYLEEISVEKPTPSQRKIIFKFSQNPFFSNHQLIKEIVETDSEDGFQVKNYSIDWKQGKNLVSGSSNVISSPDAQKRKKNETNSFFAWFSDEDREVADLIIDDLYPNAVKYYFASNEYEDEDYEEDDDDDDEEEDLEEEEDLDEDE